MNWMQPAIISTLIASLVLFLAYLYLYLTEKEKYLAIFSASWGVYSLRFLFTLLLVNKVFPVTSQILNQSLTLLSGFMLFHAACIMAQKNFNLRLYTIIFAGIAWIIYSVNAELPFIALTLPTFFLIGIIYIWTGIQFFQITEYSEPAAKILGGIFVIWGLHKIDYPFLYPIKWIAPYGFMLGAILELLCAIGIILLYFQRVKHSLSLTNRELVASEQNFRTLTENLPDIIMRFNTAFEHTYVSSTVSKYTGKVPSEFIGKTHRELGFTEEKCKYWETMLQKVIDTNLPVEENFELNTTDGNVTLNWRLIPEFTINGKIDSILSIARDITEQKKLEEQIIHSEKMRVIGELAGGVAHDFNNQLAGILGFSDMLSQSFPDESKEKNYANHIMTAAERSATLVSQLLAFARKGKYLDVPINMHEIINEIISILNHSIEKKITITPLLNAEKYTIKGDPTQIENAMLNTAINARDAISGNGTIQIITENCSLDKHFLSSMLIESEPGEYLKISITDTGCGIPPDLINRIFEPFFTTKGNMGTGLGLSAVYGTVKNHRGTLDIKSSSEGTVFSIYFPVYTENVIKTATQKESLDTFEDFCVALIDDEEISLTAAKEMLTYFKATVLAFTETNEFIRFYESNASKIHCVITDMIMPQMNGSELCKKILETNPKALIVISSGHAITEEIQVLCKRGCLFIQKPFKLQTLYAILKTLKERM